MVCGEQHSEALEEALYEEGYDTEVTLAELTGEVLQSICDAASP